MTRPFRNLLLCSGTVFCCALLSLAAHNSSPLLRQAAASSAPSPIALKEVRVSGSTRFSAQQILRASGLHIDADLTSATLQQAEQNLANSGVFTEVGAQVASGAGGETVTFQLTDMLPVVPCDFSQIQGIDPQRLSAEISSELPLFDGRVPVVNPAMLQQIREHLQQILGRHGIPGQVEQFAHIGNMSAGTSAKSHVVQSIVFRVVSPAGE